MTVPKKHYRAIFISDTHFGYGINRADRLNDFLKHHSCDTLYLVGDIFDLWVLKNKLKLTYDDILACRQIISKMKAGTKVVYLPGNHDDLLRTYLNTIAFGNVQFINEICHEGLNGKKYLVVHGDLFDSTGPIWNLLCHIGNSAYIASLHINKWYNKYRAWRGLDEWSLAQYLKSNVKGAVNYINKFEDHMIEYCRAGKYDGIICGHIHTPAMRVMDNDLAYMNSGDWIENCTALVETTDGNFEIIQWKGTNV